MILAPFLQWIAAPHGFTLRWEGPRAGTTIAHPGPRSSMTSAGSPFSPGWWWCLVGSAPGIPRSGLLWGKGCYGYRDVRLDVVIS